MYLSKVGLIIVAVVRLLFVFVVDGEVPAEDSHNTHIMRRTLISGHNNNRHLTGDELESNIGGLPVTEPKLRELFDALDSSKNGFLEFNELKKFYQSFENYGIQYTDREIQEQLKRYAKRDDGAVTFDEFSCIILSLAQR